MQLNKAKKSASGRLLGLKLYLNLLVLSLSLSICSWIVLFKIWQSKLVVVYSTNI